MSLAPEDPICSSCSRISKDVSIACTECNNLCCGTCFGLMEEEGDPEQDELVQTKRAKVARVCSRCRSADNETVEDLSSIKQEPLPKVEESTTDEPTTSVEEKVATPEGVEPTQNRCSLHDQDYTLYCLTCDELVCDRCFAIGKSHMRHQIDLVETVYQERWAKIEQKLEQIGEKAKYMQEDFVLNKKNLEILQETERSICDEIDLLCTEAKQSVTEMTEGRKQALQLRMDFPAKAQKLNDSLQEMTRQLPQAEFLKQQLLVDKQCDEMLGYSIPRIFIPKHFEDIGCELVPPYQTCSFFLDALRTNVRYQREIIVCDIRWTVELRKNDSLFVKLTPRSEEALKFLFKLLVVLPYRYKTIRKTFTVHETSEELEVVTKDQLEVERINEKSSLVVEIGLRPLNALVENGLMKQQISNAKQRLGGSTIPTDKTRTDLESILQAVAISDHSCIAYFKANLYKQKGGPLTQYSTILTDPTDRQWCLRVYAIDRIDTNTNLKASIVLCKGAPTKCQFFIELLHSDPKKNIRKIKEHVFKAINECYGWNAFIERQQLLSDPELCPNETVRFRFGVRSIAD